MKNESVLKLIKQALDVKQGDIRNIKRVGGLTNVNYSVTVNDEEMIVRIPGQGTEELVNRQAEKYNLQLGTLIGINPELVYFNEQTNMKITRKIPNPTTLTMKQARHPQAMNQIIDLLHKLHFSHHVMNNRFELFSLMHHYEELVKKVNPYFFESSHSLKEEVEELIKVYESFQVHEIPCHIDTICDNFVSSGSGKMYLIDWEYSGMFDPMWDIATLVMNNEYSHMEEQLFLVKYFGRKPTEEELQRIDLHKVFQDYLWSLWGAYKHVKGDSPEEYYIGLFKRAEMNLVLYKEKYEGQVV